MPDIVSYNGIELADIISINGLDIPAGGRSLGSGTYIFGDVGGTFIDAFKAGDDTIGPEMYAKMSSTSHDFTKVVANQYWNFWGLKSDGSLWMYNTSTSFNNTYGTQTEWTRFGNENDWEDLASGRYHFGAIKNGEVWNLGYNAYGQAGVGNTTTTTVWTRKASFTGCSKIAKGEYFTIVVKSDGTVFTAGRNANYRTGQGTQSGNTTSFTQLSGVNKATKPRAGQRDGAVIIEANSGDGFGTPYVWGYNQANHLGVSGQKTTATASTISGTGTISQITEMAIGRYTSHIIDRSGYLYRAGYSTDNPYWNESGSKTSGFDRDGSVTGFSKVFSSGARAANRAVFVKDSKHYPGGFIGPSIMEGEGNTKASSRTPIEDLTVLSGKTIDAINHVGGYQTHSFIISIA
tara:strand:- start:23385 stop:24599 length:1215 start_codon:yes stop_codon:yes gene_type:complete